MAVVPTAAEFPLGGPHPIQYMKKRNAKSCRKCGDLLRLSVCHSPVCRRKDFVVTVPKNAKKLPRNNIEKLPPERKRPEVKFSGWAGRAGRARNCYVHEGYLLAGILFVRCIDAMLSCNVINSLRLIPRKHLHRRTIKSSSKVRQFLTNKFVSLSFSVHNSEFLAT